MMLIFPEFSNLKIIFIYIFINLKAKQTILTRKGWLNVGTALGHMLMLSAQRWSDNRCCRETPKFLTVAHQLSAS